MCCTCFTEEEREVQLSAQLGMDKAEIFFPGGVGPGAPVVLCMPGRDIFCS